MTLAQVEAALDYLQVQYPRAVSLVQWLNPAFTGLALFKFDLDLTIKVLAFLFVTLPLGIVQWGNAVKFIKERRAKKNGTSQ